MAFHNVSLQCPHSNQTAPVCSNNSTLFAYLNKAHGNKAVSLDNCATCVCAHPDNDEWSRLNDPLRGESSDYERSWGRCCDGWNGTSCDVCADVSACPAKEIDGVMVEPMDCTAGEVWPRAEELLVGKRYSCTPCGSGTDNSYCVYTDEPGASFDLVAFEGFAEIAMRVGRYTSGGPLYGEHFYHQNWYAYAAMFKGELTGCSFAKEACAWDSTIPCITLTCSNTDVDCPPKTLPDCPGYEYDPCTHKYVCDGECVRRSKLGNCCIASESDDDDFYNGHRYHLTQPFCCSESGADKCQSTEIFWNDVSTVFSCEIGADDLPTGSARCYLNQDHTGVSTGFPYTCHVGNCVYNATQSIEIPTEDALIPQPRVSAQMIYVSLATIALFVGIAVVYATGQLRRRAQRIKTKQGDGFEFFKSDASNYSLLHTPSRGDGTNNGSDVVDGNQNDDGAHGGASNSSAAPRSSRAAVEEVGYDDDPLDLPDVEDASSVASGSLFGGPPPGSAVGALTWSNVRVQSGQFDALRGVGGSARCGAVSAILGPSGAGKSSLLRALGGRLATDSVSFGTVRLDNEALSASRRRETMAFVPQEDSALPAALTVKEHLLFHATLRRHALVKRRLASSRTTSSRRRMAYRRDAEDAVRSVVAALDLEVCAGRTIGQRPDDDDAAADGARGISGGEARRVSVAAELLGEPSVVLLDEPTSRLDAKAALALAVSLRRVARGGAFSSRMVAKKKRHQDPSLGAYPVVLASMHQPRAEIFYEALDSVYLLARGRLVWAGNVEQATALARQRRLLLESRRPAFSDDVVPPAWPIDPNPADMLMDAVDEAVSTLGVRERRGLIDDNEAAAFRKAVETALQLHDRDEDDEDDESEETSRCGEEEFAAVRRGDGTVWAPAPVATQLGVLLERQIIRAARAPSLLLLHAGGSLAAALCLGSIDHNPPRDLGGAQRRVEAIFFALFFLALLALTAISAFRDDAVVANYERAALGGLYGPLAHFVSVVLIDAVALRLLPALIFAAVAYPLAGFRFRCAGLCVVRFTASLVLTALSSGFAALALGSCVANVTAANAIGALGVLAMALFGGVAVDVNSGEDTSSRVSGGSSAALGLSNIVVKFAASCNALYYAFRAAVIGEFAGQEDSVGHPMVYVIDADKCDPSFKPVPVDVEAILVTLDLPTQPSKADEALIGLAVVTIVWLGVAAIAHYVCSGPQFGIEDADLRARRGSAMSRARFWLRGDCSPSARSGGGPLALPFVTATENGHGGMLRPASSSRCCGCMETFDVEIPEASSSSAHSGSGSASSALAGRPSPLETANPLVMGSDGGEGQSNEYLQQSLLPTTRQGSRTAEARFWQRDDDGDSDDDARDLLHAASSDGVPCLCRSPEVSCNNVTLSVSEWRSTRKACLPQRHVLNVLDECSFAAKPATVTALLGPSGAGKSSLLDVLAGRRTTGKMSAASVVCVDGLSTTATERRRLSRYAPQDDLLPPRLTAAEHLEFHGRLRLPQSWSDARKTRSAMREARRLGLTLANDFDATKVLLSRASGGQRRRITLATELVAKTRLFFCDEPTTGLDAATALLACRRLRRVSRRGVTVVAVLHQPRPEIFFDLDVVALVVKGRVAFVGSPKQAARQFIGGPTTSLTATINPADAMLDAVTTTTSAPPRQQHHHRRRFDVDGNSQRSGGEREILPDEEKKIEEGAAEGPRPSVFDTTNRSESGSLPPIGGYRSSAQSGQFAAWQEAPSPWNMFRLLAWREARAISRDFVSLTLHFVPALAIGALLGVVYDDLPSKDDTAAGITDRFGLAFIICTTVGLLALSAAPRSRRAARLFSRERDALRDTAFPSFVASAFVGDAIPLRIVPPAALAYVAATLSRCCRTKENKIGFVVAAAQLHYALAAVGRALGAIAPRDGVCAGCSALVLLFSLLLCGFFVEPTDLPNPPWKQIARVFPARYAYETLNAHMFAQVDQLFIVSKVGGADVKEGPFTGTTILNCFGLDNVSKAFSKHVALGIFGLVADVLTALAYKLFARERR